MKYIAVLLALSFAALAQQPRTTKLDNHYIGETVQEWLAAEHMDLNDICDPAKQPKKIKKGVVTECQAVSKVRDTGEGNYRTGGVKDKKRPSVEWFFSNGRVNQAE
jgi:hypothetical protein